MCQAMSYALCLMRLGYRRSDAVPLYMCQEMSYALSLLCLMLGYRRSEFARPCPIIEASSLSECGAAAVRPRGKMRPSDICFQNREVIRRLGVL